MDMDMDMDVVVVVITILHTVLYGIWSIIIYKSVIHYIKPLVQKIR